MTPLSVLIAIAIFALLVAGLMHEARALERAEADEPAASEAP